VTLAFGVILLSLAGDPAALDEWSDQLVAVTTEHGFPNWHSLGIIYRGWVKVNNGEVAEGISLLGSGSKAYRATGAETMAPHHFTLLARACAIAGQVAWTMLCGSLEGQVNAG